LRWGKVAKMNSEFVFVEGGLIELRLVELVNVMKMVMDLVNVMKMMEDVKAMMSEWVNLESYVCTTPMIQSVVHTCCVHSHFELTQMSFVRLLTEKSEFEIVQFVVLMRVTIVFHN
jgi:hypothetical protein